MSQLISKLLILGGWFYISLALLIIFGLFSSKKISDKLPILILLFGAAFTFLTSISALYENFSQIKLFFRTDKEKIETSTFNQFSFAKIIRETLTPQHYNCVFWSWDVPTKYIIQESYPIRLETIWTFESATKCDFVVSQFVSRPELNTQPIIVFENNYIYKLKEE